MSDSNALLSDAALGPVDKILTQSPCPENQVLVDVTPFDTAAEGSELGTMKGGSDDFRSFYAGYLDKQYPNDDVAQDNAYTRLRDYWTLQSYIKAFGGKDDSWDPLMGFNANVARIFRLYDYYRSLFNSNENQFLWAGLGRMAGGAVLGGLQFLVKSYPDPSFITNTMVLIGKQIFLDLAWQHELFQTDNQKAIMAAQSHDARYHAKMSYGNAWGAIASGDSTKIAAGNLMLLANEQFSIIQPLYDAIKAEPEAALDFAKTSAFTANIHPYHLDFFTAMPPGKDVTNIEDRWAWITQPDGMWEKWVNMPAGERRRLVNLPMPDIIGQKWGNPDDLITSLIPPGSH